MCRVCCRFQLKDSHQGLGMGELATEWLCLFQLMLGYRELGIRMYKQTSRLGVTCI